MMAFIHKAKKHKTNWCALKLDMAKAFDKVSWNFLTAILKVMGFPDQFIMWIQQCVGTVAYNLLLNGQRVGRVNPQRGLRQGDPLSPFLFILCANCLSIMLQKAENERVITGIRHASSGPRINHLMYADDTVLFFKADQESCNRVKEILIHYCSLAGQQVNYDKSLAVFSPNTPRLFKKFMSATLGVKVSNGLGKYLGVFVDGDNVIQVNSESLKERMESRLKGWKANLLSQAGRCTLIKSILQADQIYKMSSFQLLKKDTNRMNSHAINFFWG